MLKTFIFLLAFCPLFLRASLPDSLLLVKQKEHLLSDKEKADLYNDLFKTYLNENVDSALYYGKLAEELCTKTGYEKGLASYFNNQGIYNKDIGNYYTALLWYHKYLQMAEKLNDPKSTGAAYNNIGIVYKLQKNKNLALDYFQRSLAIKLKNGKEKDISSTLNNIGNVFIEEQLWDSSLHYYFKAKEINKKYGNLKFLCVNLRNISEVYILRGKPDSASVYLPQAASLIAQIDPDKKQLCEWFNLMALFQFKIKNYEQALLYADSAEQIIRKGKFKSELLDIYKLYADLYGEWGNYEKAFAYSKSYNLLRDSVYKESISVQVADLQQSYDLRKMDAHVEQLKQQKYFFAIIACLVAVLLLSAVYFLRKRKQTITLLDLKNKELRKLNEEKNELIRLVAHDLKSPLSRVNMLSQLILQDKDISREEQEQFMEIVRDTSKESLEMIIKFLSLEKSDIVDYHLKIEPVNLQDLLHNKVKNCTPLAKEKNILLKENIALN
ncbi:MAG: tetratricopeptide repeat-containing sensor histidine kinase, partial [Bacteroidia bacterium]|nr:tetratricopeptide repeat-containing sensor histidine kinase [Bacteroidia bacterium]